MKNKTKFTFLTLVLAAGLIISACGKTPSEQSQSSINQNSDSSMPESTSSAQESTSSAQQSTSSSQQSTSSSQATNKCTVNFVVDGQVVQSSQVEREKLLNIEVQHLQKHPLVQPFTDLKVGIKI